MKRLLIYIICIGFISTTATAQNEGKLDASFATNGVALHLSSNERYVAHSMGETILPISADKVILHSYCSRNQNSYYGFTMMNLNGHIDSSYATDGSFYIPVPFGLDYTKYISPGLTSDFKIVFGGYSTVVPKSFTVLKFKTNGNRDSSFGVNGESAWMISPFAQKTNGIKVLSDDKMLIFGSIADTTGEKGFIARLMPDGKLDSTFNTNGYLTFSFVGAAKSSFQAMVLQADGKIVALSAYDGLNLARFNTNGTLDLSYGNSGSIRHVTGVGKFNWLDYDIYKPGNLVYALGEYAKTPSDVNITLFRFLGDGSLDSSFGTKGIATLSPKYNGLNKLTVLPTNEPVVTYDSLIYKYSSTGVRDTTFGYGGTVKIQEKLSYRNLIFDIRSITTDKIMFWGNYGSTDAYFSASVGVVNFSGKVDSVFEVNGLKMLETGTYSSDGNNRCKINQTAITSTKKILIGGSLQRYFEKELMVMRFNSDGSRDISFGVNGTVILDSGEVKSICSLPDNSILVGGYKVKLLRKIGVLYKLKPNGTIDSSFGINGSFTYTGPLDNRNSINSISLTSSGDIQLSCYGMKLLSPGGTLYPTWFQNYATGNLNPNHHIILPGGKIIALGDSSIECYKASGLAETSFGFVGSYSEKWSGNCSGTPYAKSYVYRDFNITDAGQILIRGFSSSEKDTFCEPSKSMNLLLLDTLGKKVTGFASAGRYSEAADSALNGNMLLRNGNIYLIGLRSHPGTFNLNIHKLTSSGVPDNTFGTSSLLQIPINLSYAYNAKDYPVHSNLFGTDQFIVVGNYRDTIMITRHNFSVPVPSDTLVNFTSPKVIGQPGDTFRLFPTISPGTRTFRWIIEGNPAFVKGSNPFSQNPYIVFKDTGYFDCMLSAKFGTPDSAYRLKQDYFHIGYKPVANIFVPQRNGYPGATFLIRDSSLHFPAGWTWDIQPADFSFTGCDAHSQNINVVFTKTGLYAVSLKVSNDFGSDSVTKTSWIHVFPTGLSELSFASGSIFPNPASDNLYVTFDGTFKAELFSGSGEKVAELNHLNDADNTSINVSSLPQAIYILKVTSGSSTYFEKIAVVR